MTTPEATTEEAELTPPSFADLPLTDRTRAAISGMGWEVPTPVQLETYGPAVEKNDLIVQARTGTGKTAAFGIPLVDRLVDPEKGTQALVLSPTRELALQSAKQIEELAGDGNLKVTAVYGGAPMPPQIRAIEGGAQIISGTPGRVLDHLKRGHLDGQSLTFLVLDEADEMLSMGFARELNAIMERLNPERQTLLFSATVDDDVKRMATRHMTDPVFVTLSGDVVGASTVAHYAYMVKGLGRERDLIRVLEAEDPESAIIFCNTKSETETTAAALQHAGYSARWLNGDLPQKERERIMEQTRVGKLRFLVATDVAARGIDISHLTHVINFSFPQSAAQYIHRTGRTGRAGRTGTALSLISAQELSSLYYLRLQYKIFPVERTLPSAGDDRTRLEADRLMMLERGFSARPSELDYAVARRLLTHPEVERLVGSLVGNFFGSSPEEETNDNAAAARRSRMPAPVPEPQAEASPKPRSKGRRSAPRKTESESESAAPAKRRRRTRRSRDGESERPAAQAAAPVAEETAPSTNQAPPTEEREAPARSRRRRSASPPKKTEFALDEGETILKVNFGKQDSVGARDLGMFILKHSGLDRSAIRRVRVRDKTSLVVVTDEGARAIIDKVAGQDLEGRPLKVARVRSRS